MSMKIGAGAPPVSHSQATQHAPSTKGSEKAQAAGGSDPMAQLQQLLEMLQQLEGGQAAGGQAAGKGHKGHGTHVGW